MITSLLWLAAIAIHFWFHDLGHTLGTTWCVQSKADSKKRVGLPWLSDALESLAIPILDTPYELEKQSFRHQWKRGTAHTLAFMLGKLWGEPLEVVIATRAYPWWLWLIYLAAACATAGL